MFSQIKYEEIDSVGVLTLNSPETGNVISDEMRNEIRLCVTEVKNNKKLRALILTAEGKNFCVGGNVNVMIERLESNMPYNERYEIFMRDVASMVLHIKSIEIPTIAVLNGGAYGAGASIALLCDIRIASEHCKMGFLFGKRALVPDWGCNYTLPRLVGYGNALMLTATGKILSATDAQAMGLVNMVVPHEQRMEAALSMCRQIATSGPMAVRETKKMLQMSANQTLAENVAYEAMVQSLCQTSPEHIEGVRSFQEKREPNY